MFKNEDNEIKIVDRLKVKKFPVIEKEDNNKNENSNNNIPQSY